MALLHKISYCCGFLSNRSLGLQCKRQSWDPTFIFCIGLLGVSVLIGSLWWILEPKLSLQQCIQELSNLFWSLAVLVATPYSCELCAVQSSSSACLLLKFVLRECHWVPQLKATCFCRTSSDNKPLWDFPLPFLLTQILFFYSLLKSSLFPFSILLFCLFFFSPSFLPRVVLPAVLTGQAVALWNSMKCLWGFKNLIW